MKKAQSFNIFTSILDLSLRLWEWPAFGPYILWPGTCEKWAFV